MQDSRSKEINERQRTASPAEGKSAIDQGRQQIKEWEKATQQRTSEGRLEYREKVARLKAQLDQYSTAKMEIYAGNDVPPKFRIVGDEPSWTTLQSAGQQSSSDSLSAAGDNGKNRDRAGDNTQHAEKLLNTILRYEVTIRDSAYRSSTKSTGSIKQKLEQIKIAADKLALVNGKITTHNESRFWDKYPDAEISRSGEYATIVYNTLNTPELRNHLKNVRARIDKDMEQQE